MSSPETLLRDPQWVAKNSRWRFWTWTLGIFHWVAFLWIAYKAKEQRWAVFGFGYALPFAVVIALTPESDTAGPDPLEYDLAIVAMVIVGIVSIFHARHLLPEYLAKRADMESAPGYGATPADEAARMLSETRGTSAPPTPPSPPAAATEHPVVQSAKADAAALRTSAPPPPARATPEPSGASDTMLDINTADEASIAALQGVGVVLAKRAMALRQEKGPFLSVDDFGQSLGLKPHALERLRPQLTVSQRGASARPGGRVVDF